MSERVYYCKCFQRASSKGFDRNLQRVSKMFAKGLLRVFKGFPKNLLGVFKELLKKLQGFLKGLQTVNREVKHDVYGRRQTAKITSDFPFFSCNPYK